MGVGVGVVERQRLREAFFLPPRRWGAVLHEVLVGGEAAMQAGALECAAKPGDLMLVPELWCV